MIRNILILYIVLLILALYKFPNLLYIQDKTNGIPNYFLLFLLVIMCGSLAYVGYFYYTMRPL